MDISNENIFIIIVVSVHRKNERSSKREMQVIFFS